MWVGHQGVRRTNYGAWKHWLACFSGVLARRFHWCQTVGTAQAEEESVDARKAFPLPLHTQLGMQGKTSPPLPHLEALQEMAREDMTGLTIEVQDVDDEE